MLELNANAFLGAVTKVRSLIHRIENVPEQNAIILGEDRAFIANHLSDLIHEVNIIGARSALVASQRFLQQMLSDSPEIRYIEAKQRIEEIESRFADHLIDIRLFVLNQGDAALMQPADNLLATTDQPVTGFSQAFPNASFEIEEAAKCIALSRHTASVFHTMRALECGIKALCGFIGVPDATKPAEKNWGVILRVIKEKIDEKWPRSNRLRDSTGAKMEALYATLDAVKNPWRNATMHVETLYAPHEAVHIARCTGMFLLELAKHCDEKGRTEAEAPAMTDTGDRISSDQISG